MLYYVLIRATFISSTMKEIWFNLASIKMAHSYVMNDV